MNLWITLSPTIFLYYESRSNTIKLDDAAHRNDYLCSDLCHQNWIASCSMLYAFYFPIFIWVCALFLHLNGEIFHFPLFKVMKRVVWSHVTHHFAMHSTHKMQAQNLATALIYCLFGSVDRSLACSFSLIPSRSLCLSQWCCTTIVVVIIITHSHTWRVCR